MVVSKPRGPFEGLNVERSRVVLEFLSEHPPIIAGNLWILADKVISMGGFSEGRRPMYIVLYGLEMRNYILQEARYFRVTAGGRRALADTAEE